MNINLIHGKDMEDGYIYFPSRTDEKSKGCKISKAALRKLKNRCQALSQY